MAEVEEQDDTDMLKVKQQIERYNENMQSNHVSICDQVDYFDI